MRVRVDEIPEAGRTLRFHWDQERLEAFVPPGDPFELKLARPLNVAVEINRRTDHIRVTGTIEGVLEVACHRCLTPFPWPVNEPIDVFLIEEGRVGGEEEIELEAEEMSYEFFDGEIIEVDQLVAEQVFLALPVKVLCSENCLGICPGCGANLNEEACRCKRDLKGSAFSKLEQIRPRLPDSRDA
jgi:uncharacterized protein